jgi:hypothetical protein
VGFIILIASIVLDVFLGWAAYSLLGWAGLIILSVIFVILFALYLVVGQARLSTAVVNWIAAPVLLVIPLIACWLFGWLVWQIGYIAAINNAVEGWLAPQHNVFGLLLWVFVSFGWPIVWIVGLALCMFGALFGFIATYSLGSNDDATAVSATWLGIVICLVGALLSGGMTAIVNYYSF